VPAAPTRRGTIGDVSSSDPRRSADEPHAGRQRLDADQLVEINRFPDDNPNPVLRIDADGHLIYANPASRGVLRALGATVGQALAPDLVERLAAAGLARVFLEFVWENRTYAVWPVPIPDLNFTNLYGMDVTAERAIVKFPDQNPNPVFRIRWDGSLLYANPASTGLVAALGLVIGAGLPENLREQILGAARAADRAAVEVEAGERSYALVAVDVPEFDFVNVYGTDVTAVKEQRRLARENERLLLNILPEPIAQRLRDGEPLIADRFDDVTMLFADIVDFTRLSAAMSPDELVGVLNAVFTAFDALVERHGLEKVKTIGDAYMVVGGMADPPGDHTIRVAAMALELAEAVAAIEAAVQLGIIFRVGIHCGPVVAGVIGSKKFIYDVWGDTVNLASRMESMGVPGRIQVTQGVMERVAGRFTCEERGIIDVKGKGLMQTYFLVGERAPR
jgi:class 3 adenylate cyclase